MKLMLNIGEKVTLFHPRHWVEHEESIITAKHGATRHYGRCLGVVMRVSVQSRDQNYEMIEKPFVRPLENVVPLPDDSGAIRAKFEIHWAVKEELANATADLSCRVQCYQGKPKFCSGTTACFYPRPRSSVISALCPPTGTRRSDQGFGG